MSLESQITKLETQRKTLEQKLETLKQKRTQEVSRFIQEIDLKDMDSVTLIGMLLETLEKPLSQEEKERWHRRGKKFCRQTKTRLSKPVHQTPSTKAA